MTRISPACVLSRRQRRRHKPCSRQPCVLTVDFESELRFTWFCRLCFSPFIFLFGEEVAKGCVKDTLPSRLSSRICPPPLLLCPLLLQPNVTSWLRLPASGPCVELLRVFRLGRMRTIQPQCGRKGEKNTQGRQRLEETWQQRDCRFKV